MADKDLLDTELEDEEIGNATDDEGEIDEGSEEGASGQDEGDGQRDEEPAQAEPPARTGGRANERIRRLNDKVREAERAAKAAQERLDRLERDRNEWQSTSQRAAEEARMAGMTQEERAVYQHDQRLRQIEQAQARVAFEARDSMDMAKFNSECASNETLRSIAAEVDAELARLRANGTNASRFDVAKWMLGDRILKQAPTVAKQRQAAKAAVNKGRGKPGPGRGDATTGGGKAQRGSVEDFESRFGDVQL